MARVLGAEIVLTGKREIEVCVDRRIASLVWAVYARTGACTCAAPPGPMDSTLHEPYCGWEEISNFTEVQVMSTGLNPADALAKLIHEGVQAYERPGTEFKMVPCPWGGSGTSALGL